MKKNLKTKQGKKVTTPLDHKHDGSKYGSKYKDEEKKTLRATRNHYRNKAETGALEKQSVVKGMEM
jgi:hypothetical protein